MAGHWHASAVARKVSRNDCRSSPSPMHQHRQCLSNTSVCRFCSLSSCTLYTATSSWCMTTIFTNIRTNSWSSCTGCAGSESNMAAGFRHHCEHHGKWETNAAIYSRDGENRVYTSVMSLKVNKRYKHIFDQRNLNSLRQLSCNFCKVFRNSSPGY